MSLNNNYFFVDGSALLGDIKRIRKLHPNQSGIRLNLKMFVQYFSGSLFQMYHSGAYRRFVFYFVDNDERLNSLVLLPDFTKPGEVIDLRVEFCGKRIKTFEQAKIWLDDHSAPEHVRECLYRSEKAVDTQICCDALQLAATGKLDRLFLYTNDFDFTPLCRTLRQMGTNINLFRLRGDDVNQELVKECDAFHEMDPASMRLCMSIPESTESETGNA
jgi:uncharacterized LabA/DUF88 family protein